MRLAFFVDPLETFHIKKDSTMAMMVEAASRGHSIYVFGYQNIFLAEERVSVICQEIELSGHYEKDWYRIIDTQKIALSSFDAVIVRKDPPFDMYYVNALWLFSLAEKQGARFFNTAKSILNHNEKLSIGSFLSFVAPTLVSANEAQIREFHAHHGDIVLKPLVGMGGMGVFRVQSNGLNLGSIIETLTDRGQKQIMVQAYIPEITAGDKRVLLINGKVVPFALARIPKAGEVRGNLAAGGMGKAQPLTTRDREIAETLAQELVKQGLFLVGLDIIGEWLTEINVTSPTCFREITDQTGFNVAGMFIDELEKVLFS